LCCPLHGKKVEVQLLPEATPRTQQTGHTSSRSATQHAPFPNHQIKL